MKPVDRKWMEEREDRLDAAAGINPLPPRGRMPPAYDVGDTCAECFEWIGIWGWPSRWMHRRKYGHAPVPMNPALTEEYQHARNVADAKAWRERDR
jgi:hypothetical protein